MVILTSCRGNFGSAILEFDLMQKEYICIYSQENKADKNRLYPAVEFEVAEIFPQDAREADCEKSCEYKRSFETSENTSQTTELL